MQLALPIGPGVRAGAIEVGRHRDAKLLEPREQGDVLRLQKRLIAIEGARRVKRPGHTVTDRQEQVNSTKRWRQIDGVVIGPDLDLRQRIAPDRERILGPEEL